MKLHDFLILVLIVVIIVFIIYKSNCCNSCPEKFSDKCPQACLPGSVGTDCQASSGACFDKVGSQCPGGTVACDGKNTLPPLKDWCCRHDQGAKQTSRCEDETFPTPPHPVCRKSGKQCDGDYDCTHTGGGGGGGGGGDCKTNQKNLVDKPSALFSNDSNSFKKGCSVSSDCTNYCQGVAKQGCEFCKIDKDMGPSCGSLNIINKDNSNSGTDNIINQGNINEYMKYSCPLHRIARVKQNDGSFKQIKQVNSEYEWDGQTNYRNWCSGANMHFDLSEEPTQTQSGNTLLRYRPVSCESYGWDAEKQASEAGQDGTGCPNPGGDTPLWMKKDFEKYKGKWEGLATHTYVGTDPQFCGGSITDPHVTKKSGVEYRRGAIPMSYICRKYGKTDEDLKNKTTGTKYGYKSNYGSKDSLCWELQPILDKDVDLTKLKQSQGGLCTGNDCLDLSSYASSGPLHVIQAGTACGGNCKAMPAKCSDEEFSHKYIPSAPYYPPLNSIQEENIKHCVLRKGGGGGGSGSTGCISMISNAEYIADQENPNSNYDTVCARDMIKLGKSSSPKKNIGGWLMNSAGIQDDEGATVICNGYFQTTVAGPPTTSWTSLPSGKKSYITIGGQNVPSTVFNSFTYKQLKQPYTGGYDQNPKNTGYGLGTLYNGIDFDLEFTIIGNTRTNGITNEELIGDDNTKNHVIQLSKSALNDGHYIQWTVMGNPYNALQNGITYKNLKTGIDQLQNTNNFTNNFTLALMLYGGSMGGCSLKSDTNTPFADWGIPDKYWNNSDAINKTVQQMKNIQSNNTNPFKGTLGYLGDWIKNQSQHGVHFSQINLAVSTIGCTKGMINLYSKLCKEIGFAGILFWRFGYCKGPTGGGTGGGGGSFCANPADISKLLCNQPCTTKTDCKGKYTPGVWSCQSDTNNVCANTPSPHSPTPYSPTPYSPTPSPSPYTPTPIPNNCDKFTNKPCCLYRGTGNNPDQCRIDVSQSDCIDRIWCS